MFNKRGVSPVIATVLLLLLTVAAVSVIAAFIIPFVRNNLQSSTECIPYREYFKFDETFNFNCFDSKYNYALSIKASPAQESVSGKIIGFDILLIGDGESKKISMRNNQPACGGNITIFKGDCPSDALLKIPGSGETITYLYHGDRRYNAAEVYPVISGERICDKTESINLIYCKPGAI